MSATAAASAADAGAASPGSARGAADEKLFELVVRWYGPPKLARMHALKHEQLRGEFGALFDAFAASALPTAPLPAPPAGLSAEQETLWTLGLVVLCDQVSRNAFRGKPRAYATDGLARRLADARLRHRFDELPVAVRLSVVLVYIHSEDAADVAVVEELLARLRPALEPVSPFVWASISAIAQNHRDRMRLFGRVPERNAILGRASTEAEIVYMASTGGI
jgi:uncharacterized protein (DUF924 family)